MKTLLALLLLIPSLSWGSVLDEYKCTRYDDKSEEIELYIIVRFENYFKDNLGNKYSYEDDDEKYYTLWNDAKSPRELSVILSKDGSVLHLLDNDKYFGCSIAAKSEKTDE